MRGVVSKERDRTAECTHGDKHRLQFCGAPSSGATRERASERYGIVQAQQCLRSNSQREGQRSAGKATQEKQKI